MLSCAFTSYCLLLGDTKRDKQETATWIVLSVEFFYCFGKKQILKDLRMKDASHHERNTSQNSVISGTLPYVSRKTFIVSLYWYNTAQP